jgi:hypothetical protein
MKNTLKMFAVLCLGILFPILANANIVENEVVIISDPSTETNQDGQGGITSDPSIDTNQDDPIVPDAPIVTESRSSRSSSGSRANNSSVILAISSSTNKIIASTAASCNYLSSYLKIDGDNDSNEVTKLQAFLKNIENINVDINGKFDDKTFEGVKVFQAKYIEETMAPWGSRTPSGQVFFTTKKKINEVYCKSSFALTAEQLAQINSYKNNLAQGIIGINPATSTGTSTINSEIGSIDNSSQVAAVGASVGGKLWNFVKWLFGK